VLDSTTPTPTQQLRFHPLADIFPLLGGDGFDELVADIKAHGLLEPIVMVDGLIIDGRNRYRACIEAGIEPTFIPYRGDDPGAFVVSANIHRRHLDAGQKRELIARLLKTQPEKSDRQTAKAAAVDHKTVATVRSDLEGCGEIPHVEVRTDTQGRKQPAARRRGRNKERHKKLRVEKRGRNSLPAEVTYEVGGRRVSETEFRRLVEAETHKLAAELAVKLVKLDPECARMLHEILCDGRPFALMVALERELGIEP
jgi:hypothetical protein